MHWRVISWDLLSFFMVKASSSVIHLGTRLAKSDYNS